MQLLFVKTSMENKIKHFNHCKFDAIETMVVVVTVVICLFLFIPKLQILSFALHISIHILTYALPPCHNYLNK